MHLITRRTALALAASASLSSPARTEEKPIVIMSTYAG